MEPRHPDAPDTVLFACSECGGSMDHDGEHPVNARSGAYGKYVAVHYRCQDCNETTVGHPITGEYDL